MRNASNLPVEIYSLDFDTRWIDDEELLRTASVYNEDGVALLPPREPGQVY